MKNMYLMTTAVIALCTATNMASAQSITSGDDLWTGGFVGIGGSFLDVSADLQSEGLGFGGYTEGNSDWDGDFWTEGAGGQSIATGSGAFGFIEVGADQQTNQLVVGGFASYDFGSADATASSETSWYTEGCEVGCYEGPASIDATISVGNNWTIGGRAGYLAGPRTLVYGMVGFSSAQMSMSVGNTLDGFFEGESDLTVGYDSEVMTVSGNTFGAGIEHMFLNNWSMKLEYRTTVYDGSDLSDGGWAPFEGDGDPYIGEFGGGASIGDITTSSVRASANYRF